MVLFAYVASLPLFGIVPVGPGYSKACAMIPIAKRIGQVLIILINPYFVWIA